MIVTHVFEALVARGLGRFISWLYRYWITGLKGFDTFRARVQWAGFSSFVVFLAFFLIAMEFEEADTETIDFLFPVLMGYMVFVTLGLPIFLWLLEKVWNLISKTAWVGFLSRSFGTCGCFDAARH